MLQFQNRNHIIYLLEKYRTLIIVGETGCGKSTQIPQVSYIRLSTSGHNFVRSFIKCSRKQFFLSFFFFFEIYAIIFPKLEGHSNIIDQSIFKSFRLMRKVFSAFFINHQRKKRFLPSSLVLKFLKKYKKAYKNF